MDFGRGEFAPSCGNGAHSPPRAKKRKNAIRLVLRILGTFRSHFCGSAFKALRPSQVPDPSRAGGKHVWGEPIGTILGLPITTNGPPSHAWSWLQRGARAKRRRGGGRKQVNRQLYPWACPIRGSPARLGSGRGAGSRDVFFYVFYMCLLSCLLQSQPLPPQSQPIVAHQPWSILNLRFRRLAPTPSPPKSMLLQCASNDRKKKWT